MLKKFVIIYIYIYLHPKRKKLNEEGQKVQIDKRFPNLKSTVPLSRITEYQQKTYCERVVFAPI